MNTLVRGAGEPVTVFAHGLGASIAETRPLASGVTGTKVFYTARAHDGTAVERFDYEVLAADLRAVADAHGARRALGVSMGAGALCRALCQVPDRFDRAVFFLPAVVDEPRDHSTRQRMARLDAHAAAGDVDRVAALVAADLPAAVRDTPAARGYATARARTLCQPSMRGVAARLAEQVAVPDPAALATVTAETLVLGCHGDAAHPAAVAERLAAVLPVSQVHLFDGPDIMWTGRHELRERIGRFLDC